MISDFIKENVDKKIRPSESRSSQHRCGDLAVDDIVVDASGLEALALVVPSDLADQMKVLQFADDEVALGVGVVVGGVIHLEGEAGQRKAGVPGARADPERRLVERRPIRIEPEFGRVQRLIGALELKAQKRM